MVTDAPSSAVGDSRSPKKTRASGIANIGAVDESTVETATPAYLTDATNITELSAVRIPSATSRTRAAPPVRPRPLAPTRAHGVAQSTIAASGNRIACVVTASISRRGGLRRTAETAQASDASVAIPTPSQNRSSGVRSAHGRGHPAEQERAPDGRAGSVDHHRAEPGLKRAREEARHRPGQRRAERGEGAESRLRDHPEIVRQPPVLTLFARPCYSHATVRKEADDGRPLGPLPPAAPQDAGRIRRRRGRRPRVVGGAPRRPPT